MEKHNRILVVVPCFNEAERLPVDEFLRAAQKAGSALDFLFVNDGSRDATADVLQNMKSRQPDRILYLEMPRNAGKAEAVRQGVLQGMKMGAYRFIGFLDADLSSPPEEIEFLRQYSSFLGGGHEFMFGSRMKHLGTDIQRHPLRHYFGRIAATAASLSLELPVYDTQCGVKLFGSSICEKLFETPFLSRWLFDVEIFFRLKAHFSKEEFQQKVLEIPLRVWKETSGTKLNLRDVVKVPLELWKIHRHYAGNNRF